MTTPTNPIPVASSDPSLSVVLPPGKIEEQQEVGDCNQDVPVATSYQPLDYGWSETDYEVEQAIKEFMQSDHANH
jgi:hypothetical protein